MSAMPDNIVQFNLPAKKPRIYVKDPMPDQRKVCVMPFRAVFDKQLSHGALQALAALCTYCNRAGITWVSQTRLAKELDISQQAVAKQFKQLRELGYLETIRKGFKGERTDTLRVIFDKSVDAETAMAVTSSMEDTRPPVIRKEQQAAADKADREGLERVQKAISKALKQPARKAPIVVKRTDTMTVRNIKSAMKKAQSNSEQPVDNHAHIHNPQVVKEPFIKRMNSSNLTSVLNNSEIENLIADGIEPEQIADNLATLLPLYQAEGITPTSKTLMDGIRQLKADAR